MLGQHPRKFGVHCVSKDGLERATKRVFAMRECGSDAKQVYERRLSLERRQAIAPRIGECMVHLIENNVRGRFDYMLGQLVKALQEAENERGS